MGEPIEDAFQIKNTDPDKKLRVDPQVEEELSQLAEKINAGTIAVFLEAQDLVIQKVPEQQRHKMMEIFLKKRHDKRRTRDTGPIRKPR